MRIKILDKYWGVEFKHLPPTKDVPHPLGYCDPPWKKGKKIYISNRLRNPELLLDVLIHEMLHGADWYKDEEWIELVARDIARAVCRFFHVTPRKETHERTK